MNLSSPIISALLACGTLWVASCSIPDHPMPETTTDISSEPDDWPIANRRSMKGWELYSWPSESPTTLGWSFALVEGTNMLKDENRIKRHAIHCLDELIAALASISDGEYIWHSPRLGTPPHELRAMIAKMCEEREILTLPFPLDEQ